MDCFKLSTAFHVIYFVTNHRLIQIVLTTQLQRLTFLRNDIILHWKLSQLQDLRKWHCVGVYIPSQNQNFPGFPRKSSKFRLLFTFFSCRNPSTPPNFDPSREPCFCNSFPPISTSSLKSRRNRGTSPQ